MKQHPINKQPIQVPVKEPMSNKKRKLLQTMCGDSFSGGWVHEKLNKEKEQKK